MAHALTASEELALCLISEWLGETFHNRTMADYRAIALKMPKLDALHEHVSDRWQELWKNGFFERRLIYTVHQSDGHSYYSKYPRSISKETVRTALVKSGWREFIRRCKEECPA